MAGDASDVFTLQLQLAIIGTPGFVCPSISSFSLGGLSLSQSHSGVEPVLIPLCKWSLRHFRSTHNTPFFAQSILCRHCVCATHNGGMPHALRTIVRVLLLLWIILHFYLSAWRPRSTPKSTEHRGELPALLPTTLIACWCFTLTHNSDIIFFVCHIIDNTKE